MDEKECKECEYELLNLIDNGLNVLCYPKSNILNWKQHSDIIKVLKYQEHQFRTATEQLNIAKEALNSVDKMYYSYSEGFNNIEKALLACKKVAQEALSKIEEVK